MALLMTALLTLVPRGDVDRKLQTTIFVEFRDVTLSDAIETFRAATGLNFVVRDGPDLKVRLILKEVSAKSALRLLLQPLDLSAVFEDGAVVIRRRQDEATSLRVYDVRAAMARIQDFPGADISMQQGSYCLLGCFPMVEDASPAHPLAEQLVSLIQEHCGGGRSRREDPGVSVSLVNGLLLVRQTREGHRRVEEFLKAFGL